MSSTILLIILSGEETVFVDNSFLDCPIQVEVVYQVEVCSELYTAGMIVLCVSKEDDNQISHNLQGVISL